MEIFIDADGSPIVDITLKIAEKNNIPVYYLISVYSLYRIYAAKKGLLHSHNDLTNSGDQRSPYI
ncbi:MAG: hypothetical protein ACI4I6_08575 [Hominimerdicola sp.]